MRNQQETAGTSSDARSESQRSESASTQQSASSGSEVARPLQPATEPSAGRSPRRGLMNQFRSGMGVSPWELMRNMSEEIDRLIDNLGGRSAALAPTTSRGVRGAGDYSGLWAATWTPTVEVAQKPNAIVFRAELPGLKPEDVNISVNDGLLTISGERKQEHEEKQDGFLRTERLYGTFYRAFTLPEGAEEEKIAAAFKNGVLEITVPTSERERGRRIKVES